ncbi:MAG: hypothetical protein ACON3Z_07190 [Bradymonadia bacterium]
MTDLAVYRALGERDCQSVLRALVDVIQGDELLSVLASERLFERPAAPDAIFQDLETLGFMRLHQAYTEKVRRLKELRTHHRQAESELPDLERRLNTLGVQLKHAGEQAGKNRLLKKRQTQWQESSRVEALERERNQLMQQRAKARAAIEQCRSFFEALSFEFGRAEDGNRYVWLNGAVRYLTPHGHFLLETLKSAPQQHLKGRRLTDVLMVGQLLT